MKQLLVFLGLFSGCLFGQYTSPFNGKQVELSQPGGYSFIVSGHFYGGGGNKSHFPANTLLGNMHVFNDTNNAMLVCLGDLFKDISNDIPNYEQSFFSQLEVPLFNAVGNHDLTDNIYQDNYGETSFMFQVGKDIHIILDTEQDDGNIREGQLTLLKDTERKVNNGDIQNVFIYSHRTVWVDAYAKMDGLFLDNTQAIGGTNFEDDVLPLIAQMKGKAEVFWFSGSLGTAPASFFYFDDTGSGLKIIGTAIRALPRDAVLKVLVKNEGVRFETISLTGQTLENLEYYNVDFWQTEVGEEPFNWRLVPYYIKTAVLHRYFWYGVLSVVVVFFFIRLFLRRRSRRVARKASQAISELH